MERFGAESHRGGLSFENDSNEIQRNKKKNLSNPKKESHVVSLFCTEYFFLKNLE